MKVGLVRHYKVKKEYPSQFLISAKELDQWFAEYDESDIELGQTDLGGIEWNRCYASDMPRAARTAEHIFDGTITQWKTLREVSPPSFRTKVRLPLMMWAVLIKTAWFMAPRSMPESLGHVRKRADAVLDEIFRQGDGNVLIVSHAALMMTMRKALLARGFRGPKYDTPENGKLYVFEN
ncbi:histidine phosphatase family protein [Paenibacillus ehimensis]|uniref:Histidine phosphatase family protein n=1 Tax=Paenibacillus ehimensis TaxID=79264 RepID=A0ABT8V5F4_9BACL|nr:histidine phosphatase family protein [Paenibacillus ehimensis]MDO3676677.1 histidine phosphatase family protein [Paenibacillus ehimensis]